MAEFIMEMNAIKKDR